MLEPNESLIWRGKPNPPFSISLLEVDGYHDVVTGPVNPLSIILGIVIFGIWHFVTNEMWLVVVLMSIIGVAVLAAPELIKRRRKKKTEYAFSRNRIFFKLWYLWKERIVAVDFNDIGKITTETYKDKAGVIYFMMKNEPQFKTYDFITSERRFHPTFEFVAEVENLSSQLRELMKKRKWETNSLTIDKRKEEKHH